MSNSTSLAYLDRLTSMGSPIRADENSLFRSLVRHRHVRRDLIVSHERGFRDHLPHIATTLILSRFTTDGESALRNNRLKAPLGKIITCITSDQLGPDGPQRSELRIDLLDDEDFNVSAGMQLDPTSTIFDASRREWLKWGVVLAHSENPNTISTGFLPDISGRITQALAVISQQQAP